MKTQTLPTLDLQGNDQIALVDSMGNHLIKYGAFILRNHGIPLPLIERCYALGRQFFDLPYEQQKPYVIVDDGFVTGFSPMFSERAAGATVADGKRFWNQHRRYPGHTYHVPKEILGFGDALTSFYEEFDRLVKILFTNVCSFLGKPDLASIVDYGDHLVRLIDYPEVIGDAKYVRAAKHRDINLLTGLFGHKHEVGGLHILTHEGQIIEVQHDPADMVIQSGIMLDLITKGEIRATEHWVVNRPERRLKLAAFGHPQREAVIGQKNDQPYTAGEALLEVLAQINSPVA